MVTSSRKWKKYLSTILVSGLVLSNASFVSAEITTKAPNTNLEKDAKVLNVLSNEKAKLVKQLAEKKFDKKDKVWQGGACWRTQRIRLEK